MNDWHQSVIVEPSILAGDFGSLATEAKKLEEAGADAIHIDIMDGHFVPNLTLGPKAVAAINRSTDLFLDVHLMIYNPFEYVERFVEAGADRIVFHLEATENVEDVLHYIRKCGVQAGLAISPDTSASLVVKYLDKCDLVLLMSVNPGFGGQTFLPKALEKISYVRQLCDQLGIRKGGKVKPDASLPSFDIQVDGGIDDKNSRDCIAAGANVIVSGTYIFKSPDMRKAIQILKTGKRA